MSEKVSAKTVVYLAYQFGLAAAHAPAETQAQVQQGLLELCNQAERDQIVEICNKGEAEGKSLGQMLEELIPTL